MTNELVRVETMSSAVTSHNTILRNLSMKLGVSDAILRKGSELSRLLQLKTATSSKILQQFSDSCRHILCLDLAASSIGVAFDRETAILLSGTKKKLYMNGYHMFEKMLGLEQNISVKTVCIQLGCSEVIDLAENVLKRYEEDYSKGINKNKPLDLQHPMYAAFAVYCACRHRKIKVSKKSLIEISRVKVASFDKMTSEMSPLLAGMEPKRITKKRKPSSLDEVEEGMKAPQCHKPKLGGFESCYEDNLSAANNYEAWKKKMLEEAGEQHA